MTTAPLVFGVFDGRRFQLKNNLFQIEMLNQRTFIIRVTQLNTSNLFSVHSSIVFCRIVVVIDDTW